MIEYIKSLISDSNDASHKRLIAIGSFVALIIILVCNLFGINVNDSILYTFAGLAGGQSVLTVIDKIKTGK